MNSDSNENHVTRFSRSRVPSQPSLSTYGNVVTSSSEVGMILPSVMVSSGNSSYTVMEVPYGVKSLKELSSLFVVVISSGNSLTILVLITYKLCNITVGLLGTTFRGFSDIEGN
ncbi:hypothetical protein LWI28_005417 [Acer negundo]|uniref:Uncharacterized protein n=1 Tax=Acer negundo TaxID=4023 RepID=A0AAD5JHW7_ACENE|nr:hypothetical protein LWI28_005417 [Acer negundo]